MTLADSEKAELHEALMRVAAERARYKAALRNVPEYSQGGRCFACGVTIIDLPSRPHAPDCAWQEVNR